MAVTKNLPKGHSIGALVLGVMELLLGLIVIIICGVLSSKASLPTILTPFWAAIPVSQLLFNSSPQIEHNHDYSDYNV